MKMQQITLGPDGKVVKVGKPVELGFVQPARRRRRRKRKGGAK